MAHQATNLSLHDMKVVVVVGCLVILLQDTQGMMARGAGGGGRGGRRNPYARRPWEIGYVGQRVGGRRPWDSDHWRTDRGGLSQGGGAWQPRRGEPGEEPEQEEECGRPCVVQRVQEMIKMQEVLKLHEEEEDKESKEHYDMSLLEDMGEQEDQEEQEKLEDQEKIRSCRGMCAIMRMRTGK